MLTFFLIKHLLTWIIFWIVAGGGILAGGGWWWWIYFGWWWIYFGWWCMVVGGGEFRLTHSYLYIFFSVVRFTHLNVKNYNHLVILIYYLGKLKLD